LREVTVKIGLGRINTWEGVIVEALFDSDTTKLVMSLEFVRKEVSKIEAADLIYFYFYFYFSFNLFSIFLFLELRVRVRVMRSCSHIR